MTKKKQQKQQKEEHIEAKDNASNENEKSLDLEPYALGYWLSLIHI